MTVQLVLSLFPGIGLLDQAFEAHGFCVVRGPDLLWGGDVCTFLPPASRFDGVIGGPPCQAFSRLRHLVEAKGLNTAPNLIPHFERIVAAAGPRWFVMENVDAAPLPAVEGYRVQTQRLADHWCGGATGRIRRFSFGWLGEDAPRFYVEGKVLVPTNPRPAVTATGGREVPVKRGGSGKVKSTWRRGPRGAAYLAQAIRDQGLPEGFLGEAPFTLAGKIKAIGNGVPLPMGNAVAAEVRAALGRVEGQE